MSIQSGALRAAAIALVTLPLLAEHHIAKHEIGLTLGTLVPSSRGGARTNLDLGSGVSFQANYGFRLAGGDNATLYGEVHFLANPLREVTSASTALTRDVATLFLTPGVRLKFRPAGRFAPYLTAGAGYAAFEQSDRRLDGAPNQAVRYLNRAAVTFGGGFDVKIWRIFSLRAEVRDFYSGSPDFNTTAIRGGQHNVVLGGGFVVRFH